MNVIQSIGAVLTPLGLLWTLIIIGVATILHELAHYALARWQGVKVHSFSVGMGPVLLKKVWRGTEWRISLLPLGGYVEIDGMAPQEGPGGPGHALQTPTHGFAALATWGKIAVLLAGPVMNLALAIGLMTVQFSSQGVPQPDRARIESVMPNSQASALGLRAGDVITAVNGVILSTSKKDGKLRLGLEAVKEALMTSGHKSFTVEQGKRTQVVSFEWQAKKDGHQQRLGIRYAPDIQKTSIPAAFTLSLQTTADAAPQILHAFGNLLSRFVTLNLSQDENVRGPIGTAEVVSVAATQSPWALLEIAILLNLSLAFFNLLPIPGLDGGRILLILVGALRGRPLSFSGEQSIHLAGFAFVILLMVFVVVRDVNRFF